MENVDVAKERKGVRMNFGINIRDRWVDITMKKLGFAKLRVILDLDKRGLPKRGLPEYLERLKKNFPPYVVEMVELGIKSKQDNPNQDRIDIDIVASHKPGCPEEEGTGKCNCNPHIVGIGDGKLTCKKCGESSIGKTINSNVVEDDTGCWDRFWIEWGDMSYWVVPTPGTELGSLICDVCMIEQGIKFPSVI
jgi:hypothetical protein